MHEGMIKTNSLSSMTVGSCAFMGICLSIRDPFTATTIRQEVESRNILMELSMTFVVSMHETLEMAVQMIPIMLQPHVNVSLQVSIRVQPFLQLSEQLRKTLLELQIHTA